MFCFKKSYFSLALGLFFIEVLIALFAEGFIRTFMGDLLIVIFLYTASRSFFKSTPLKTGLIILLLAYFTEFIQSFNILDYFNLSDSKTMILLIGHRFDWWDILAYTLGIGITLTIEFILSYRKN